MTHILIIIALLVMPALAAAQPGQPKVGNPTNGPTTVSFPVTWTASTNPYVWTAGYNDGNNGQPNSFTGNATTNSTTIAIPYHFDHLAASAFITIRDTNGLSTSNSFNVPSRTTQTRTLTWTQNAPFTQDSFVIFRGLSTTQTCTPDATNIYATVGAAATSFVDTASSNPVSCYDVQSKCAICVSDGGVSNIAITPSSFPPAAASGLILR